MSSGVAMANCVATSRRRTRLTDTPPVDARPVALELRVGDEPGVDGLAEQLALAGYERVDRVDERGQFAVRGGLLDVFPSTGREPLRVDFFGDEIEQVRAFSPFTQRALHTADQTIVYPASERRGDLVEADLGGDDGDASVPEPPSDLVPAVDRPPDLLWQPDEVRRVFRMAVKMHLCHSAKAKDANIRQALIDRLGPPGTKKAPGPTYGVTSHAWPALAIAVTVADSLPAARAMPSAELMDAF